MIANAGEKFREIAAAMCGMRGGLVSRRLLEQAVVTEPITEAAVTHAYEWLPHHVGGGGANRLPRSEKSPPRSAECEPGAILPTTTGALLVSAEGPSTITNVRCSP